MNSSLSLLADGLQPWRANFRGGALSKLYLPANCSDAMRSVLHHWTGQGARTIVMPLNVAAEVLPSALSWALGVRSLPPQDAVPMNELGVRDPWASNYLLHGWVDVSEPAGIIVPSTASLSHVIMALCSVFVIGHVVLMLVMMAFFTFMATSPTVRRWTQRQHAKAD
ncbi:MAG: hypothetical protein EOO65_01855 [Methanosarcinales archaeon]|nr:MAG: hypothetical protein EOO65_01855 [Methanosarcinales archaeon]